MSKTLSESAAEILKASMSAAKEPAQKLPAEMDDLGGQTPTTAPSDIGKKAAAAASEAPKPATKGDAKGVKVQAMEETETDETAEVVAEVAAEETAEDSLEEGKTKLPMPIKAMKEEEEVVAEAKSEDDEEDKDEEEEKDEKEMKEAWKKDMVKKHKVQCQKMLTLSSMANHYPKNSVQRQQRFSKLLFSHALKRLLKT